MKAVCITAPKTIKLIEVPIPELKDDELLIKVAYAGICGTDSAIYEGEFSFVKNGLITYPCRIGHEFSGVVAKVGKNVTKFKEGDRVITDNGVSCRECPACKAGKPEKCENNKSVGTVHCWDGGMAEYIKMPEMHTYKLTDKISLMEAALIEPVTISLASLINAEALKPGLTVLVVGTGPIGLATAALAVTYGAKKVYIAGRQESKLQIGRDYGAEAVNVTEVDLVEYMKEVGQVDVAVETSGAIGCIQQCVYSVKGYGCVALAGFYETMLNDFDIDSLVYSAAKIVGVSGQRIMQDVIDLIDAGKLNLKPLITHHFTLEEAPEIVAKAEKEYRSKIRMLVDIDPTLEKLF